MKRTSLVAVAVLALAAATTVPVATAQPLPAIPPMPALPALPALPPLPGLEAFGMALPPEVMLGGAVVAGLGVAALAAMMLGGPAGSGDAAGSLGSLMPSQPAPTTSAKPTATSTTTTTPTTPKPPVEPVPFEPTEGDTVDVALSASAAGATADGKRAAGEAVTYTATLAPAADGQGYGAVMVRFVPDATEKITAVDFKTTGCILTAGNHVESAGMWYFSCGKDSSIEVQATTTSTAADGDIVRPHFETSGSDRENNPLSADLAPVTMDGKKLGATTSQAIGKPVVAPLPITIGKQY